LTSKHVLHASRVISPAARSKQEGLLRDLTMLRPGKGDISSGAGL
jgi:hypothetical protein